MSDLEKMAEDFVQTWCLLPEEEWNSVDSKKDLIAVLQQVRDKAIEDKGKALQIAIDGLKEYEKHGFTYSGAKTQARITLSSIEAALKDPQATKER